MANLTQIRQAFTQDWNQPQLPAQDSWLIKGDFDHFKMMNDLYGPLICDTLLDWTLEVVETVLEKHQRCRGLAPVLCNATGDDLTLYLPGSRLAESDIEGLLVAIRKAIRQSFWQRYRVAALPLPADFWDGMSSAALQNLKTALESADMVFDFARRQRGYLLLFPTGQHGEVQLALDQAAQLLRQHTSKPLPSLTPVDDWIYSPEDQSCSVYNEGWLEPPQVTFAACSVRTVTRGLPLESKPAFELSSQACHELLRVCKNQRLGTLVNCLPGSPFSKPTPPADQPSARPSPRLHWSSERYLRELIYTRELDRPILFQINPVYAPVHPWQGMQIQPEQYRGNAYGIGLKGINELFSHKAGDQCIRWLVTSFSEGLERFLDQKKISPDRVWIAQFVDRITICTDPAVCSLAEMTSLVQRMAAGFHETPHEVRISHIRLNAVQAERRVMGYELFHQLALTGLAAHSSQFLSSQPPLEVWQNQPSALQEGATILERLSFQAARQLSGFAGYGALALTALGFQAQCLFVDQVPAM